MIETPDPSVDNLLSAKAVRARCADLMAWTESGGDSHFRWNADALPRAAEYVAAEIRRNYPDLAVPYHSRWRHFEFAGEDLAAAVLEAKPPTAAVLDASFPTTDGLEASPLTAPLARADAPETSDRNKPTPDLPSPDRLEVARRRIDLVIPSVLLDAGAGPQWMFHDPVTDMRVARSEGLALASLRGFAGGLFSSIPESPLRTDARGLQGLSAEKLAAGLQVSATNPLVGVDSRRAVLNRLGAVLAARQDVFGEEGRLGNLLDHFLALASPAGEIDADAVLQTLLEIFGTIWPARVQWRGRALSDCWRHPAARDALVPFHKLAQWLSYSLLEPLQDAGVIIRGLEELTGLPEYRNGGLFIDLGVIVPRNPAQLSREWTLDASAVIEWRALTVIGLDRLADAVRQTLELSPAAFPLPCVLQGGSWAAGRRIARELRPNGDPPIRIAIDGVTF
jgi:hypothetical protein